MYPYQGYYPPQAYAPQPRNAAGTASLVLGIIGCVFALLLWPIGLTLGIIGLPLAVTGWKRVRTGVATNSRAATAGIVTSATSLGVAVIVAFLGLVSLAVGL